MCRFSGLKALLSEAQGKGSPEDTPDMALTYILLGILRKGPQNARVQP